ncbi:dystrotelin [Acomys russatus]|uniref:dystrotelin n=1 Tax=Acomys russatus TaxID=60746 RepID=UPI0021E1F353|nr:dystrotelin [Acomys russatus]
MMQLQLPLLCLKLLGSERNNQPYPRMLYLEIRYSSTFPTFRTVVLLIGLRTLSIEQPSNYDLCKLFANEIRLHPWFTLPAVDLMDSSLIQRVLWCGRVGESTETSLSVQQLFQELQELFQRMGNPEEVYPRAPELTLSLLMAMYDRKQQESMLSRARLTRRVLRALLTDLQQVFNLCSLRELHSYEHHCSGTCTPFSTANKGLPLQIPTVVGESCTLCPVESAINSCFRGVLSSGIKEEKFLTWAQSEPPVLLWAPNLLPTVSLRGSYSPCAVQCLQNLPDHRTETDLGRMWGCGVISNHDFLEETECKDNIQSHVAPDEEKEQVGSEGALNRAENSVYRTAFKLRSVQTLCQLDLMDSSLIQRVLWCGRVGESTETSLSVQQLFQELQELFQRMGNPEEVYPRAPELTLSLLMAMYDSTGSGFLRLQPVAAALVALSGDSPLTKYRAFFQLYAENNRRADASRARLTRRVLRALLTDLQQIPTVVGESCTLCPVESAINSCFRGVLSSGIKEEKFLTWAQSEPPVLLWLPTCYRLSASEAVTHPVRCSVCRTFPITGLRYRCLKCLNFDVCQLCFLSGRHRKSHEQSHTVMEDHVQVSATENTKLLFRSLRNILPQRHDRTGRQWLLTQLASREAASHAQTRLWPKAPMYVRPTGAVAAAATEHTRFLCQKLTPSPQANDNPHHQAIVNIKEELWRTRDSISTLHRERKLLRKQLNRYKHKLQGTYTLQEEHNCRFETKIRELTTSQDNLWAKLQQMRQDLQAMLRPLHLSSSPQKTTPSKTDHSLPDDVFWRGDSLLIKSIIRDSASWELHADPAKADESHKCQAGSGKALPDSELPEIILKSNRTRSHLQKVLKEDNPRIPPAEVSNSAQTPSPGKERDHASEKRNAPEEEELQALLPRLLDAFDLDTPSGLQPLVDVELYGRAQQVCNAFSALVDQITLPSPE